MLAQLASLIYTVHGGQKARQASVEDFMPRLEKASTGDEAADVLLAWAESFEQSER